MNKLLLSLVSIAAFVQKSLRFSTLTAPPSSRTPNIPHHGHSKFRPHAPNDGHWHMKYHRGRH